MKTIKLAVMSILEKLSIISDRLDNSDLNLDYIDMAAIFFMNSLPYQISKDYFLEHEFDDNGIKCGTKYSDVIRNGEECRLIRSSLRFKAQKENSQYYASENDPVFYKKAGFLYVLPKKKSSNDEFLVNKIPNSFIKNSELSNVPEESEYIILMLSGHIILYKKARDKRYLLSGYIGEISDRLTSFDSKKPESSPEITDFYFEEPAPTHPVISLDIETHSISLEDITDIADSIGVDVSDLDLSFDSSGLDDTNLNIDLSEDFTGIEDTIDYDEIDLTIDFLSDAPSLDLSEVTFPTIDLTDTFKAIENAYEFVGSLDTSDDENAKDVPKGAFWLDDEDPEMVQSAIQLASQEVNRANSIANSQLSSLQTHKTEIDAKISEFRGKLEAYTSENNLKVQEIQSKLSLYQSKIKVKSDEVQSKIAVVNGKLSELEAKINKALSKIQVDLQARDANNQIIINREQLTVQEYSTRIQNYSAKLNKIVQREQMQLKEWETRVQQEIQENNQLLQKFQNEINAYSVKFQNKLNEWSSNTNKEFKEFENNLNLAMNELQTIQAISSKLQIDSQEYNQLISESNQMYQKYQNEYQKFLGYYGSNEDN